VAVGLEWTHAEFFREGEGLAEALIEPFANEGGDVFPVVVDHLPIVSQKQVALPQVEGRHHLKAEVPAGRGEGAMPFSFEDGASDRGPDVALRSPYDPPDQGSARNPCSPRVSHTACRWR